METVWWPSADASAVAPVADHEDLRDAVRSILTEIADHAAVRRAATSDLGYSSETWSALAEDLGLASVSIPEEAGGLEFSLREIAVILEETGAALLPEPVVNSAVLGTKALAPLIEKEPDSYSNIIDGSAVVTVWLGEGKATGFTAQMSGDQWVLNGQAEAFQFATAAQFAVVTATVNNQEGLFLIDLSSDGIEHQKQESLDLTRKMFRVTLDSVAAKQLDTLGSTDVETLRQLRMVAIAAEQTGMIAHLLDSTKDYLLQREQFGRKLGSFQAIKHRMADVLINLERARSASQYAAAIFETADPQERRLAALIARAVCQEAVLATAYEAIQLNGGTGFTWEHSAHYYLRRALADEALYGSADNCRDEISTLLVAS
jgi:acyl-CoA dehydrogenase